MRYGSLNFASFLKNRIGLQEHWPIAKMSIARKEARETCYWLRLLTETKIGPESQLAEISSEADEITRILTAIVKTSQKGKTNA